MSIPVQNLTRSLGRQAEQLATQNLKDRGYAILDHNWRRPWGEIDIIAFRKEVTHFIEVKGQAVERTGFPAHY
jgi:putative endonuclease